jgi:hypothetical protein
MKKDCIFEWLKNHVGILLIVGLAFMIISPIILTLSAPCKFMEISNIDSLGSNIGGLTAPIISFLGALIIYLAFKEQNLNNIQNEHNKLFDDLKNDIDKLEYYEEITNEYLFDAGKFGPILKEGNINYYNKFLGVKALSSYCKLVNDANSNETICLIKETIFSDLLIISKNIEYFLDKINSSKDKKSDYIYKLQVLFEFKLKENLKILIDKFNTFEKDKEKENRQKDKVDEIEFNQFLNKNRINFKNLNDIYEKLEKLNNF